MKVVPYYLQELSALVTHLKYAVDNLCEAESKMAEHRASLPCLECAKHQNASEVLEDVKKIAADYGCRCECDCGAPERQHTRECYTDLCWGCELRRVI